jgi:hypothetical protein
MIEVVHEKGQISSFGFVRHVEDDSFQTRKMVYFQNHHSLNTLK